MAFLLIFVYFIYNNVICISVASIINKTVRIINNIESFKSSLNNLQPFESSPQAVHVPEEAPHLLRISTGEAPRRAAIRIN